MSWLWAIIVGLVLGLIAKAIIPGKQAIPIWLTVICGILGSILGNWLAAGIGVEDTKGIDWIRHLLQLVGAVIIVAVGDRLWAAVRRPRPTDRLGGRKAESGRRPVRADHVPAAGKCAGGAGRGTLAAR